MSFADDHLIPRFRELGVFTGGSLIVGSAARTDLLGADRTGEPARLREGT